MAASKPSIVGRLAIKIQPDTTGFNSEIKKKLKETRDTINDTKISIDLNARVSRESIKTAQRRIDSAKEKMSTAIDLPVDVTDVAKANEKVESISRDRDIDVTMTGLDKAVASAKAKLKGLSKNKTVSVAVDVAQQSVNRAKATLNSISDNQTFRITADVSKASVATAKKTINRVAGTRTANIVVSVSKPALAKAKASIASLSKSASGIGFGSLSSGLQATGNKVKGVTTALSKHLLKVTAGMMALGPTIVTSMAGSIALISKTAAVTASLGQALVTASGAALLLPGALAGGTIAAIGLKSTIDQAKEQLSDLGPAFKAAYDQAGTRAMAVSMDQIRATASDLIPVLTRGMRDVGNSIGVIIQKVSAAISQTRNLNALESIFASTSDALRPLGDALAHITTALLAITDVGASYLPQFSRYLSDVAQTFADWATSAADSGKINGWINDGLEALKQLWSVLTSVFGIVKGLFGAMAAGNIMPIQVLAATLEEVNQALNSTPAQAKLTGVVNSASQAIAAAKPGFEALFGAIGNLAPVLGNIMVMSGKAVGALGTALGAAFGQEGFGQGLQDLFAGILAGIQNLFPAIETLGKLIGPLGSFFGTLAETLGSTLSNALVSLAPTLERVFAVAETALQPLGDIISRLVDGGLVDAINGILDGLIAAGPGLGAFIESLGSILTLLGNIAESAGPTLGVLGDALASVFNNPAFLEGIQMLFDGLFQGIEGLTPGIEALAPLVGSLGGLLGPLLAQIGRVIGTLVQALAPALTSIADKLAPLVQVLGDSLVWAIEQLSPLLDWLGNFLGDVLAGAVNVVVDAFNAIIALLTGDWGKAWEYAKRLIVDFVKLLKDTLGGAINGIGKFFGQDWHIFGSDFGNDSGPTVTPTVSPQDLDKPSAPADFGPRPRERNSGGVTNITINNPINEPSSESIRRNSRLAGLER
uniref:phage tail protein n=1 Tax=uncultured Corynebacterium sp. TaxID=159447 RepID=UPI0025D3F4BC|nr:hypothetical protein [uncultured Corynebacterium sp.]